METISAIRYICVKHDDIDKNPLSLLLSTATGQTHPPLQRVPTFTAAVTSSSANNPETTSPLKASRPRKLAKAISFCCDGRNKNY